MDMFILDISLSDSLSDSLSSSLQWVCSKRKYSVDKQIPIRIRIRIRVRIRIRFSGFGPLESIFTTWFHILLTVFYKFDFGFGYFLIKSSQFETQLLPSPHIFLRSH